MPPEMVYFPRKNIDWTFPEMRGLRVPKFREFKLATITDVSRDGFPRADERALQRLTRDGIALAQPVCVRLKKGRRVYVVAADAAEGAQWFDILEENNTGGFRSASLG